MFIIVISLCIGHIIPPDIGIIVHMGDHHTFRRQISIPACVLTIFNDVIFILMRLVFQHIGTATLADGFQPCDVKVFLDIGNILICQPATLMLLVSRISCRTFAVIIVIACTHQVVVAHSEPSRITSIIQVRESHAMGELMAKSSDTIKFAITIQLCAAGISIHCDAIKGKRLTIIRCRKIKHVRPYRRFSTAICFSLSCIKHKHLVYFAIAVPVVFGEINTLSGCPLTSFSHHLASTKVVALRIISSIIGTLVLQLTDSYDIKVEFELSCTLRLEVIFHAARKTIIGIVLTIDHFLVK